MVTDHLRIAVENIYIEMFSGAAWNKKVVLIVYFW